MEKYKIKKLVTNTFLKIRFYFTRTKATSKRGGESSQYLYSICALLWRKGNKGFGWNLTILKNASISTQTRKQYIDKSI